MFCPPYPPFRKILAALTAALAIGLAAPARADAPIETGARFLPGYFQGVASSATADVDAGVLSLQLTHFAAAFCPCGGTNGETTLRRVGPLSITGLVTVGATRASAYGLRTATSAESRQTATVSRINLLGGLITAGTITGAASVHATATKLTAGDGGSHFLHLVIAGKVIAANTPPNTTIPIPGLGSATIFSTTTTGDGKNSIGITVDAVLITVTEANSLGLNVGAHIAIGHAVATYNRANPDHVVTGHAYIANASVQALNLLPDFGVLGGVGIGDCAGTHGKTLMNQVAGFTAGPLMIGAATTSAFGGPQGKNRATVQTQASIAGVALLGGLIGANSIVSEATETAVGNKISASTAGTEFGGLTIAGIQFPLNVPPNTQVTLPLLGYVILNEQTGPLTGGRGKLTVIALDIYITTPNLMGLPVGTEITLGEADATALPLPL